MTAFTSDDREWKKTIKMLINILYGHRGAEEVGAGQARSAFRCAAAEANITLLAGKTMRVLVSALSVCLVARV